MLHGSCLCGTVRYEISGKPLVMYHCHCETCRAASGALHATNIMVSASDFTVTAGRDRLSAFESSPRKHRYFCSNCGSPIYSHSQHTAHLVSVRTGTLHDDPGLRPAYHAYVASKAPWTAIDDQLPQYPQARP